MLPLTVHRRYFFPNFSDRVELPTRIEILQPVEPSDYVDVMPHNDSAVVRSGPVRVLLEYPRPSVGFSVVRFNNRGRAATAPAANGEKHFERVPGTRERGCY